MHVVTAIWTVDSSWLTLGLVSLPPGRRNMNLMESRAVLALNDSADIPKMKRS